jgi:hypothetical protein
LRAKAVAAAAAKERGRFFGNNAVTILVNAKWNPAECVSRRDPRSTPHRKGGQVERRLNESTQTSLA